MNNITRTEELPMVMYDTSHSFSLNTNVNGNYVYVLILFMLFNYIFYWIDMSLHQLEITIVNKHNLKYGRRFFKNLITIQFLPVQSKKIPVI
jgi:hypothetical protein